MRSRPPFIVALALAALIAPVLAAPVGAANGGASAEHARVLAYWTPARMRAAVPRDLRPVASPRAKPGGGGGAVTGASWTKGGPVLDLTGKVFFHMGTGDWICSGSVVNDSRSAYSVVLTAGHCAVDDATGAFATNWMFIPNFDANPTYSCPDTTYGCWSAVALSAHYGFVHAGAFNTQATTHDWAFATVGAGGKGGGLPAQLDARGSYPIQYTSGLSGQRLEAFGYPAAGKYHGSDLTWCAGSIFSDPYNANATWGMSCDMTGGSSGGPWFQGLNESNGTGGTLSSLNSYGYSGIKNMYGPKFNGQTQATFAAADSATGGNITVGTAP